MRGPLWFGLFAAPLAWSLQELLGYGLSARACGASPVLRAAPGLGASELALAAAALLVAGSALVISRSAWRRSGDGHPDGNRDALAAGPGTDRFMALGGMLVSAIFLFGILMNLAAYFIVPPCA